VAQVSVTPGFSPVIARGQMRDRFNGLWPWPKAVETANRNKVRWATRLKPGVKEIGSAKNSVRSGMVSL